MPKPSDLLQGTLDLLILKTIASKPLHGWGIAKRIQALSGDALAVGQGSLYPALHRLENQGWICATWEESNLGPVSYTHLDVYKRQRLGLEGQTWASLLQPHVTGLLSGYDLNADIASTFAQTSIVFHGGLGQVTLRHGLVQAADSQETCYLFDADFFTDQRIEIEHVDEKLDFFNRQSGRLFRWCIGNVLHEAMGPQPVLP